jgi:hypothetical protein
MYFIYWYDYALLPFYIVGALLYLNQYFLRRHGRDEELRKHFRTGMMWKLFGCIAIGMVYEYYYLGSYDGRFFFEGAKLLRTYLLDHPTELYNVITSTTLEFNSTNLDGLDMSSVNIFADSSFNVSKIAAFFNIFSFNAFLPCSIFFFLFAYIAVWNLFIFFVRNYNINYRVAAFCTIYIPSVMVWGSSIFKDTICFTALCWLFICGYYTFIQPRNFVRNALGLAFSVIIIANVKIYILAAFAPFYILYIFNAYKHKLSNPVARVVATPFVLVISGAAIFLLLQNAGDLLGRYSLDQVLETASLTYGYISEVQAGSAYSLDVDFSSSFGLLKAFPQGINITLFRPYPWEYLKPFTLFASLESMTMLYFTILVIFKVGILHFFKSIWTHPTIQFCFLFCIVFAFMVGISSANFGSLVRYKIPILPFYLLFLVLLYQSRFPFDPSVSNTTPSSIDK